MCVCVWGGGGGGTGVATEDYYNPPWLRPWGGGVKLAIVDPTLFFKQWYHPSQIFGHLVTSIDCYQYIKPENSHVEHFQMSQ